MVKRFVIDRIHTSKSWRPMIGTLLYKGLQKSREWYGVVRICRWDESVRMAVRTHMFRQKTSPQLVVAAIGTLSRWDAMKVEYSDASDPADREAISEIELYKRWLCGESYIPSTHMVPHSPFDDIKTAIEQFSRLPSEVVCNIIRYLVQPT